jgi:hypothetical protein
MDAVADLVARNGAAPGTGTCVTTCSDLWLQEHRPIPGQPSSTKIWGELEKVGGEVGTTPRLATVFRGLGTAGAIVGTFSLGFTVGTGLNEKFLHIGIDSGDAPAIQDPPGNYAGWQWFTGDNMRWVALAKGDSTAQAGQGQYFLTSLQGVCPYARAHGGSCEPFLKDTDSPSVAANYKVPDDAILLTDQNTSTTGRSANWSGSSFWIHQMQYAWGYASSTDPECPYSQPRFIYPKASTYFFMDVAGTPTCGPGVRLAQVKWQTDLAHDPPRDYVPGADRVDGQVMTWPNMPTSQADVRTRVATELNAHPDDYPNLLRWLEHAIEEPATFVDVPDCRGLVLSDCLTKLEQAGWSGDHHTVTRTYSGAVVSRPPRTVVKTTPERGARVAFDSEITIERNPGPDEMPTVVPAVVPGSLPSTVETQLDDARLAPHIVTAPTDDPLVGPNVVTHTPLSPRPGTQVAPGTEVAVEVNSSTAADPSPTSGSGTGTIDWGSPDAPPGIQLDPLMTAGAIGCTSFPFGVPCWVVGALNNWVGSPVTPSWHFKFPFAPDGFDVDLAIFDDYMPEIRTVLLATSLIAMAWFFLGLAFGGPSGRGKDDG